MPLFDARLFHARRQRVQAKGDGSAGRQSCITETPEGWLGVLPLLSGDRDDASSGGQAASHGHAKN